jgi:hypothetical protein
VGYIAPARVAVRRLTPILPLLLFPLPLYAQAGSLALDEAERLLAGGHPAEAIAAVKPPFDRFEFSTVEEITRVHRVLGVAYCETGDADKAREHLESLLLFSPKADLGNGPAGPRCRKLFDRIKNPAAAPTAASASNPAPLPTPRAAPPPLPAPPVYGGTPPILLVPFGTGQFQNGESAKGMAFLSSELAGTALAVTSLILFKAEENADGTYRDEGAAELYRGLFWGGVGATTGLMVWGIVDAVVTHRKLFGPSARLRTTPNGLAWAF